MLPVLIIGCGRRDCGDDAVGALVAERLTAMRLPDTEVWIEETPAVDLLDRISGARPDNAPRLLVFVDAAQAGPVTPVGTWTRVDYRLASNALPCRRATSSHALSIADILKLGETLDMLPPAVWIYAVFGRQFELAAPMCRASLAAVDQVAQAIARDVRACTATKTRSAPTAGALPCTS